MKTLTKLISVALLVTLSLSILAANPAQADEAALCSPSIKVTSKANSGAGSLRQAIAGICPEGTITFDSSLAGAKIVLASSLEVSQSLNIDGSSLAQRITISGNNIVGVFDFRPGVTASLKAINISNGQDSVGKTGAMFNGGALTISNCSFTDNWSTKYGGGVIHNSGTLVITNSIFTNNATINSGYGGAIYNSSYGILTVTKSIFSSNSSPWGGGAIANYNRSAAVTVTDSTFSNNASPYHGGAIYNYQGTLDVTNSTFVGNSAGYWGGAIYIDGGGAYKKQTVTNSTIANNSAKSFGGGITSFNSKGGLTITNSTLSDNSAPKGGNIATSGGKLDLQNTIVANALSGGDCNGTVTAALNNLIESTEDQACGIQNGANGNRTGIDPLLAGLSQNGGPTQTRAPSPDSPAIDAGDDTTCAASPVNGLDQRGRKRPGGVHCDIGAYEFDKGTATYLSSDTQDGWVLESNENSNLGKGINATDTTLRLGDDPAKKQYRAVLSFSTKGLPDKAVITKVTLKVKKQGITGNKNPITLFKGFLIDIQKGPFGASALEAADFQAAARGTYGPFTPTLNTGWYEFDLTKGKSNINKSGGNDGLTQIRIRFQLDDNNDSIANTLSLYSGDAPAASRPRLIIEYYVP